MSEFESEYEDREVLEVGPYRLVEHRVRGLYAVPGHYPVGRDEFGHTKWAIPRPWSWARVCDFAAANGYSIKRGMKGVGK